MLKEKVQDDEIRSIPRKPPKQHKVKEKIRKSFNQEKCNHSNCVRFEDQFTAGSITFNAWLQNQRTEFKRRDSHQQLQFLSTMITFNRPQKSKDRQKWQSGDASMRYTFPKSYSIKLPCPGGWGVHSVCAQYFRYVFSFGKTRFRTIMAKIWQNRRCGNVLIEKDVMDVVESKEPQWVKDVEQFLVRYKRLSKSHYIEDKHVVYIDHEANKKQDWNTVHCDYIHFYQPASYDNWIRKTGAKDPSIPKPYPTFHHFLKIIPNLFQCKPRRIAQDRCNGCQQINILLSSADTVEEQDRLNKLHDDHLHRASVCYQLNSHFKRFSNKSFESRSIHVRRLPKPEMKYPGTHVHYEIDYDVDHPECVSNLNMAYFKSKIGMKSANIIQSPPDEFGSRKIYGWSGMVGGKAVEETTQCLEHCFKKRSIGAERCSITLDGALLTYKLLKFAAFNVHGKNPNRYFRSAAILSPETGHSRLEADTINSQAKRQYAKRSQFSTCQQRLEYIEENTNIETHQFKYFAQLPSIFDELFIEPAKWIDQFGKKALIRDDKGILYEVGESKIWNAMTELFEWESHWNELWIRCDEDLKQPVRKLKIFTNKINELSEDELKRLYRAIKPAPSIKKQVLEDTLEIAKLMPNSEELINYFTPTSIDDSGEIKHIQHIPNYGKITVKLNRRNQFKSMLRTNEIVSLEKYPRKGSEEKDDEECDVEKAYTIYKIKNELKVVDLKKELKNHGKKVGGRKAELIQRLLDHYEFHDS